jgi:WD40 repeat protein
MFSQQPPVTYLHREDRVVSLSEKELIVFDRKELIKRNAVSIPDAANGIELTRIWNDKDGKSVFLMGFSERTIDFSIINPLESSRITRKSLFMGDKPVFDVFPLSLSDQIVVAGLKEPTKQICSSSLYSLRKTEKLSEVSTAYPVSCVARIDDDFLMLGTEGGSIHIWNLKAKKLESSFEEMKYTVSSISIVKQHQLAICASLDRKHPNLIIVDLSSAKIISRYSLESQPLSITLHPTNNSVVIGCSDGRFRILALADIVKKK